MGQSEATITHAKKLDTLVIGTEKSYIEPNYAILKLFIAF